MPGSRLSVSEREVIMVELASVETPNWTRIGKRLGRHRSTIQREVTRNGGPRAYSAHTAEQRAQQHACRRSTKFQRDPVLAKTVRGELIAGYSPYSVSIRIGQRVRHETIYKGVYDGTLGVAPETVLRTRRTRRKHRHLRQLPNDGNYLGDFTTIHDRPAYINRRLEVGHWEGDLLCGSKNQSAMVTLVERVTRYVVALELPDGHGATATMDALTTWVGSHPYRVKSITWDRGAELTQWQRLTTNHNIAVFFCDPHSPWQNASIEHVNGLLRYWFAKRTDLSIWTQHHINHVTNILNHTHRRSLNNHTAHHRYHQQPRTKE